MGDDVSSALRVRPGPVDLDGLDPADTSLERCNSGVAPWYLIPSDRKWYRHWVVTTLLTEQLERLEPRWPKATFDVEEQTSRLVRVGVVGARQNFANFSNPETI